MIFPAILPMQEIKFVTVQQMYDRTKELPVPLLSSYDADFWADYLANYQRYDRLFNRLYKNYYFFNQDANLTAEQVQPDFTENVHDLLLMNRKRYEELFRVEQVADNEYSIIGNYDITEHKELENGKTITDALGERIVGNTMTQGAQQVDTTGKVAPYDSESFANNTSTNTSYGARADTNQTTAQEVEDTHTHAGTEEYTLTRKGNTGDKTQAEVMEKHIRLWDSFNLYKVIFGDICKELLLIDRGYI